jgi:hypothetical protein
VPVAIPTSFDKSRRVRAHTAAVRTNSPSALPLFSHASLPPRHTGRLSCAALSSPSISTFANHPPHPSPSPLSFSPSPILRLSIAGTTEQQEGGDGEGTMSGAWGGTTQKCASCGRTVYPVEELAADGRVYHRPCFRCHHCKSTLQVPLFTPFVSYPSPAREHSIVTKQQFRCRISRTVTWFFCDSGYYCERRSSQSSWAVLSLLRIAWLLLQLLYFLGLGLSVIGCMIMSTAIVQDLRTELLVAR